MTAKLYAEGTEVAAEQSRAEIERLVKRYGGDEFGYSEQPGQSTILFRAHGRRVRFVLRHPDDVAFMYLPNGAVRARSQRIIARDAELRRRWRSLLMSIKAKLDIVESGIFEFDEEFLSHIVSDDERTVYDELRPHLAKLNRGDAKLLAAGKMSP